MINEHLSSWLGFPVKDFTEEKEAKKPTSVMQKLGLAKLMPEPSVGSAFPAVEDGDRVIYRLSRGWDAKASFTEMFQAFLSNPSVNHAPGIIIGAWAGDSGDNGSDEVVALLAEMHKQLPLVKGIFIGDILSEENEISWINQCDMSALLKAYPQLEHLRIRGSNELSFSEVSGHENLKSLVIETGALAPEIVKEVLELNLPALEHLELWLGTSEYGGDTKVEDLELLLTGGLFPKLRKLGLRDSEIADDIAGVLSKSPLVERLSELDISLGTLSDVGAESLLACPTLEKLRSLDLHHHYCSLEMMARLQQAFPGVNLNDREEGDGDDRYVAVSE